MAAAAIHDFFITLSLCGASKQDRRLNLILHKHCYRHNVPRQQWVSPLQSRNTAEQSQNSAYGCLDHLVSAAKLMAAVKSKRLVAIFAINVVGYSRLMVATRAMCGPTSTARRCARSSPSKLAHRL
jgi:hypothetical protein